MGAEGRRETVQAGLWVLLMVCLGEVSHLNTLSCQKYVSVAVLFIIFKVGISG